MRSVFFILLSFLIYGSSVSAQNLIQQALDDFLKKNNVFHFTEKDSNAVKIANKTHAAYFFTNKKGQTTLTVPKGAISIKIPQGASVVHAKVVSPKFPKDTYGMLTLTRYYKGEKAEERSIGMGEIYGSTGVRVDIAIDNQEKPMAYLYFLSGMIQGFQLHKREDSLIQAFRLNEGQKEVAYETDTPAYLFYEDTKAGNTGMQIKQWFGSLNEKQFMNRLGQKLENYCIVSYKLKRP